ncbi:MAG: peptidase dimerization domain-containing protein, partial [Acidobacteria bacterium Pan2503]|nr:peptidase dimerization domain-containing protein [Candidatus Acidoferrum panamensis]
LISKDYSSPRGANGYYVVNAKWSPDSQFFVYSMSSSGGHSPWSFPMMVYGRQKNRIAGFSDMINGEPTENQLALGSKGALRYEITAKGKLAHSAYPELGHSAIHTLLDVLEEIRGIALPEDPLLGPSTLNIGTISGGRAPNVVADQAEAEVMFRTVGDPSALRQAVASAAAGRAEAREVLHTPAIRLNMLGGLPTTVVAFTTDIPTFNGAWGEPFLIGPGSIHVAHTAEERVAKKELSDAVEIYTRMTTELLATGRSAA